ncbi:unnamed protein product [Polarella glacialis]|uniref:Uncharacterized protein n=1 Tax=Polarella glacialis TaxID=89957 RepID=A0A813FWI4_POLGL|nr:unnamed protein product [Polarella glacialis]
MAWSSSPPATSDEQQPRLRATPCAQCRRPQTGPGNAAYGKVIYRPVFEPGCQHGPFCERCKRAIAARVLPSCVCRALVESWREAAWPEPKPVEPEPKPVEPEPKPVGPEPKPVEPVSRGVKVRVHGAAEPAAEILRVVVLRSAGTPDLVASSSASAPHGPLPQVAAASWLSSLPSSAPHPGNAREVTSALAAAHAAAAAAAADEMEESRLPAMAAPTLLSARPVEDNAQFKRRLGASADDSGPRPRARTSEILESSETDVAEVVSLTRAGAVHLQDPLPDCPSALLPSLDPPPHCPSAVLRLVHPCSSPTVRSCFRLAGSRLKRRDRVLQSRRRSEASSLPATATWRTTVPTESQRFVSTRGVFVTPWTSESKLRDSS